MFDFVKIALKSRKIADALLANAILNFSTKVTRTGELVDDVYVAKYKGLKFTISPSSRIELQGSLHKYWNDGLHNYNDFTLVDLQSVINNLENEFGIDSHKATIHNLEYGVNLHLPYSPNLVLENLIVFKNQPFNTMNIIGPGEGKEAYLTQYGLKIYNKGIQYKRNENILRIEKKIMKMESGIRAKVFLKDLLNISFCQGCIEDLLKSFSYVLIKEEIISCNLDTTEWRFWTTCINPLSWQQMTRKQRLKNRNIYRKIVEDYSTKSMHSYLEQNIKAKGLYLISPAGD